MNIEELIEGLLKIKEREEKSLTERLKLKIPDSEGNHIEADELLLEYINNDEVSEIFESIEKWYA